MEQTIIKKLSQIQQQLKAPKSQHNNFGNYNYRNCEDILEAVKPLLGDLVLTISDDIVSIGSRYYVKATATLSDGQNTITNTAFARESETKKGMDESQITGASSSYARKYALNGLFCIDDTKDADSADNTKNTTKTAQKEQNDPKRDEAKTSLLKLACELGAEIGLETIFIEKTLNRTFAWEKLTTAQINGIKRALESKIGEVEV